MIEEIKRLERLDFSKQLAFAYLTCERLYPNYVSFSTEVVFGNPTILRNVIDFIFKQLFRESLDEKIIQEYLLSIDQNIPYPENYATILASLALDSCTVIEETLNFLIDKKPSRLYDISTMAIDTVDMYIQDRDNMDYNTDSDFEIKVLNDPLMQEELYIQKGIISFLDKIDRINESDIYTLIQLQEK